MLVHEEKEGDRQMTRLTKTIAAVGIGLLLLPGIGRAQGQAPARLLTAIIDVQRILAESEEGKKEIARIKKVQDDKMQQLNQMEADVQKMKDKRSEERRVGKECRSRGAP